MKHWDDVSPRWHEQYERGRPGYPPAAVQVAEVTPSSTVLEVGAGTGKLTRVLLDAFASVVAIEPDPEMRRWFCSTCPRAPLVAGTAETLPVATESFDAVYVAEAFHWFDHGRAVAEIARVLRPRGALVLMWNRPLGPPQPPIADIERLLEPLWPKDVAIPLDLEPDRFAYARDWPRAFEGSAFQPLREARFANTRRLTPDEMLAFLASMGWIDALPAGEVRQLLDAVRARLVHPEYRLMFETDVRWTRLGDALR